MIMRSASHNYKIFSFTKSGSYNYKTFSCNNEILSHNHEMRCLFFSYFVNTVCFDSPVTEQVLLLAI